MTAAPDRFLEVPQQGADPEQAAAKWPADEPPQGLRRSRGGRRRRPLGGRWPPGRARRGRPEGRGRVEQRGAPRGDRPGALVDGRRCAGRRRPDASRRCECTPRPTEATRKQKEDGEGPAGVKGPGVRAGTGGRRTPAAVRTQRRRRAAVAGQFPRDHRRAATNSPGDLPDPVTTSPHQRDRLGILQRQRAAYPRSRLGQSGLHPASVTEPLVPRVLRRAELDRGPARRHPRPDEPPELRTHLTRDQHSMRHHNHPVQLGVLLRPVDSAHRERRAPDQRGRPWAAPTGSAQLRLSRSRRAGVNQPLPLRTARTWATAFP